jgi:uncharacterized membrane protein
MGFIDKYQSFLQKGIYITQSIGYTISFLFITFGIIKTFIFYTIQHINIQNNKKTNELTNFTNANLTLGESNALALSFILGVEILKLFYIKTYKQLVIVVTLVIIKLLVSYYLLKEIKEDVKNL